MTPQELKNSILQLVIQGKLVEQRPEKGTAEELFAQIQEEKQRLIAEKKIKKEKPLPEITEDEKPFDIPESWIWCRLGSVLYKLTDGTHSTPKYTVSGVPFLSVKDMSSGKLDFSNCKYISEQEHQELYLRCNPEYGDLLLTKVGTTGIPVIVDTNEQFSLFVSVALLKFNQNLICNKFLQALINSPLVQIQAAENTKGVGNKNWVMRDIANTIIILPPLAEQKRIVAKIEELLPYIDRYEQAWSKLEQFNSRFPEDMKKSLLQYAIQGKLVEQRPEEGTAEELFAQIQEEKQRLIAEKKIKKEKPLPEITEDEKPFDIPESWKWVRFSDLMNAMSTGPFGSMLHKSDYVSKGIPLVNPANIVNGKIIPLEKMMVSEDTAKRLETYTLCSGMIVIGRRGEMGRCAVVGEKEHGWICGTGSFFLTPSPLLFVAYIQTFFTTHYARAYLGGESVGTTMSNLNHKILSKMPVPLPPLAEQKRIVEKLEQLLPLCEKLKERS